METEQSRTIETHLDTFEDESKDQDYSVPLPTPLDEIMSQVRDVMDGASVAPLRRSVESIIADSELSTSDAIALRDKLTRLRQIGEALAQSAQEGFAAR